GNQLLRRRPDRFERADARTVLPRAADETAVHRGLQRPVRTMRNEPEYGHVRLRAGLGGSAAGGAESNQGKEQLETPLERTMPNPKRRRSKTRTAKRRTHDALTPAATNLCPQCPEPKAPCLFLPDFGFCTAR